MGELDPAGKDEVGKEKGDAQGEEAERQPPLGLAPLVPVRLERAGGPRGVVPQPAAGTGAGVPQATLTRARQPAVVHVCQLAQSGRRQGGRLGGESPTPDARASVLSVH